MEVTTDVTGGRLTEVRNCPICHRDFRPKVHNQKYCGDGCKLEASRVRSRGCPRKHQVIEKTCKYCGSKFTTCSEEREYCCKEHKIAAWREPRERPRFGELMKQADECGLSYGKYVAAIRAGKTYEELLKARKAELKRLEEY